MRPRGERLQKVLAARGFGSRRQIEGWISQGRIAVDGKTAQCGDRVTPRSTISIDGKPVRTGPSKTPQRVLLYNKPEGEICARSDPSGRAIVFRNLPLLKGERWIAVGRLDINTRGLLLFTNDGGLAHHLMHPGMGLEREYLCRIFGKPSPSALQKLQGGVQIDGSLLRFHQIRKRPGMNANCWYSVIVKEGKYREVRKMWEAVGCQVSRLARIRYGKIALPRGLKPGTWLELRPPEIRHLANNPDKGKVLQPKILRKTGSRKHRK